MSFRIAREVSEGPSSIEGAVRRLREGGRGGTRPRQERVAASASRRSLHHRSRHAWVTTTQRYTHLEDDDLQAQVAQLPANLVAGTSYHPRPSCH